MENSYEKPYFTVGEKQNEWKAPRSSTEKKRLVELINYVRGELGTYESQGHPGQQSMHQKCNEIENWIQNMTNPSEEEMRSKNKELEEQFDAYKQTIKPEFDAEQSNEEITEANQTSSGPDYREQDATSPNGSRIEEKSDTESIADDLSAADMNVEEGTLQQPVQQNPEAQVVQHENPEAQDQATASQDDWKKLSEKVYINYKTPLKEGYDIYKGEIRNEVPGVQPIPIAVKLLRPKGNVDKTYLREINKLIHLEKHYNVTMYKDSGYVMDCKFRSVFIAMELCHEQNLHEYILEGGKTSGEIIFHHICVGLQYIHQKGIAHRDFKPSNILISCDGMHALISDFGISKDVKKDISTIIPSNGYCGTYGWSAAEIISRGKQEINYFCADIFSLGLVGYFIMTHGKHPFSDPEFPTDAAMQHRNITKKENPNMDFIEEMPDGYIAKDLLEQLLNHNPLQRSSLERILRHPVFWDSNKKLNFIHTAHCYFRKPHETSKNVEKELNFTGTIGQKAFYYELEYFYKCKSDASDTSQNSAEEDEIYDKQKKCIETITDDWVTVLKGTSIQDSCMMKKKDREAYNTSTVDLIRYMRNRREYYLQQKEKFKNQCSRNAGMWTFWSTHFPKFFPLLYQTILPALYGDDKKTYIDEEAKYITLDKTL